MGDAVERRRVAGEGDGVQHRPLLREADIAPPETTEAKRSPSQQNQFGSFAERDEMMRVGDEEQQDEKDHEQD